VRERAARTHRYRRRDQLRPLTSLRRVRNCGSSAVTEGGVTVGLAANFDGTVHAGYGGVATCGSVWACPQCAAKVATRRADELVDVMRAVEQLGGSGFLATFTMRHAAGDRLGWNREQRRRHAGLVERESGRARGRAAGDQVDEDAAAADRAELDGLLGQRGCWDAVSYGWSRATSGGTWVKDQDRHGGLLGWAKVVEVTHGANGWHVHVHALLCFAEDASVEEVRAIVARMFGRWRKALEQHGFDASGDMGADGRIPGWDVRKAQLQNGDLADYFTKLAHEVTGSHRKEGRRPGGRTPMMLLVEAVESYRVEDVARWWEWEAASDGRKQLTWSGSSHDLRALAALGPEQTDEEIAAEELPADERLGLSAECWGWVRSTDRVCTVLDVAEIEGMSGLVRWLDEHGQTYVRGAGVGWVETPTMASGHPVPRDEGVGFGWVEGMPAVLRGRDQSGRRCRRPSDRPPRWSDDARAVLAVP